MQRAVASMLSPSDWHTSSCSAARLSFTAKNMWGTQRAAVWLAQCKGKDGCFVLTETTWYKGQYLQLADFYSALSFIFSLHYPLYFNKCSHGNDIPSVHVHNKLTLPSAAHRDDDKLNINLLLSMSLTVTTIPAIHPHRWTHLLCLLLVLLQDFGHRCVSFN